MHEENRCGAPEENYYNVGNLSTQISLRGLTREVLLTDEFSQWAITTPLYNIGEQVYQLTPELKAKYPQQPWNAVAGLRHRLVHDYDGIN